MPSLAFPSSQRAQILVDVLGLGGDHVLERDGGGLENRGESGRARGVLRRVPGQAGIADHRRIAVGNGEADLLDQAESFVHQTLAGAAGRGQRHPAHQYRVHGVRWFHRSGPGVDGGGVLAQGPLIAHLVEHDRVGVRGGRYLLHHFEDLGGAPVVGFGPFDGVGVAARHVVGFRQLGPARVDIGPPGLRTSRKLGRGVVVDVGVDVENRAGHCPLRPSIERFAAVPAS